MRRPHLLSNGERGKFLIDAQAPHAQVAIYGPAVSGLATETLAYAYQRSGNLDQAVVWYERPASPLGLLAFWEPQQRWASARYQLAVDYQERGHPEKARQTLAPLLDLWKDGDANLPLRRAALQLRAKTTQ